MKTTNRYSIAFIIALAFIATVSVISVDKVSAVNYGCDTNAGSDDYTRFPFGFFCPRNDGSSGDLNARYTQVTLDNGDSTPRGSYNTDRNSTNAEALAPGQTLNFTADYVREGGVRTAPPLPVNGPSDSPPDNNTDPTGNGVFVWVIVDGNNSILADNGLKGSTADGAWNSGTSFNAWNPDGRDTARGCPTVNAYAGSGPGDRNRSPFTAAPLDGDVTCLDQGKMIMWRLGQDDANSLGVPADNKKLRFSVKLKDDLPFGNYEVCLRTIVSVRMDMGSADTEYPFTPSKLGHIAAKSKHRCYKVSSTRIEGTVRSSETNATGKLLPAVSIFYDQNCNGDINKQTTTDANGKYEFNTNVGELYCLYARGSTGAPPPRNTEVEESGGTRYINPEGLYRGLNIVSATGITWQVAGVGCGDNAQGSNSNSDNYYPNCFGRTQDMEAGYEQESTAPDATNVKGHDFKFNPLPIAPLVEKVSFPSGTDVNGNDLPLGDPRLRPGDEISFSIYVQNSIDANQVVDIRDYIPHNIVSQMDQIQLDCVQIDPSGPAPPTWFVYDSSVDCRSEGSTLIQNTPNYFEFGNDEAEVFTYFNEPFYYREVAGSGSSAPYVGFDVRRMPAYSEITIEWSGRVKPANQIGVYPGYEAAANAGDYRYCVAPNVGTYNSTSRLMSECEDTGPNGFQGIANYVVTTAQGSITPYYSNITYNPIPGDIASITKTIDTGRLFGGIPAYSFPNDNRGIFRNVVDPIEQLGPVRYRVIDQAQPGTVYDFSGSVLDKAIGAITPDPAGTLSGATSDSLGVLTWGEYNSSSTSGNVYSFNATFDEDRPVGTQGSNRSKVCWVKYWENPHSIDCKFSDPQPFIHIKVNAPKVAADYGGVTGGGNIRIVDNEQCSAQSSLQPNLRASGDSYGMYMLTAKDNNTQNSFKSSSGFDVVGENAGGNGIRCRPDLYRSAEKYTTQPLNTMPTFTGNTLIGDTNFNGEIREFVGNLTINNNFKVKGRGTIVVDGKVFIKSNITKSTAGQFNLNNPDSLGIIATQGIYIDKNVTQVDAMLYSGTYNTISGSYSDGIINTCASDSASLNNGYTAVNCRENPLKINGIMYGRKLFLHRTRLNVFPDNVSLPASVYIFSPPLFNELFGTSSRNIRETNPRF